MPRAWIEDHAVNMPSFSGNLRHALEYALIGLALQLTDIAHVI